MVRATVSAVRRWPAGTRDHGDRTDILRLAPQHAVCAEIGVFRGEFSSQIRQKTAPREFHLIDGWWTLFGEYYPDWGEYTAHGTLPTRQAYEEACRAVPDATVHVGDDLEILESFPDRYFDWVYLDTSHDYTHTVAELAVIARKLKDNGILLGDDWHEDPTHVHAGVTKAVREACARGEWTTAVSGDRFTQWAVRLVP